MTLLTETSIFLAAAVVAVPVFKKLGLGSVLGYLAAGSLIGPYGLKLVIDVDDILHFSEIGVVLLLFIIGLELKPSRLWILRKSVFGLGSAQVGLSACILAALFYLGNLPLETSIIAGLGLALSSTAFALQILAEKNQLTTAHGRASFSILLFQDLSVAPLLALVTVLGPDTQTGDETSLWLRFLIIFGCFALLILAGRYLLRPMFRLISETQVREIFTALALLVVLGTALLMEHIGLSMALGAFFAGVMLADSEYRHELEANIEPFKGLLLGLFFLAVGMSVNYDLIASETPKVLLWVLVLMFVKFGVLYFLGRMTRLRHSSALSLAIALPQGGEFAFVLFGAAQSGGVMAKEWADLLIVVVTLSMAITPLLFLLNENVFSKRAEPAKEPDYDASEKDEVQVIIAGFGRFGQIPARILRAKRIPFTALESSSAQVDFVARFGNKIYYGDASRLELLHAAKADKAKLFLLAVDDEETSLKIAASVQKHFPQLKIFARARNRQHAFKLKRLGVEHVIRETYHSSLEMSRELLLGLGLSYSNVNNAISRFVQHDQSILEEQTEVFDDEARLIDKAKQAAIDLELLFETDQKL